MPFRVVPGLVRVEVRAGPLDILVGDNAVRGLSQIGMRVEPGVEKCDRHAASGALGANAKSQHGRHHRKAILEVAVLVYSIGSVDHALRPNSRLSNLAGDRHTARSN